MPRARRHFLPGATYHVILRGNRRQPVFLSDTDNLRFLELVHEGTRRYDHRVVSFCLMTNHVHFAIQVGDTPLSPIFHNLSFRYTQHFHRKHETVGHVFQGRYKSIPVRGPGHFRALLRYIHLNPVRAQMVQDPLDYRWSSHRAFLGKEDLPWLSPQLGLTGFGKTKRGSVNAFHKFVMSGVGAEERFDPDTGALAVDTQTLVDAALEWHGLDREELAQGNRSRLVTQAQATAALLARRVKGITLDELAEYFGRQPQSLSRAATRLQARVEASPVLQREVDALYEEMRSIVCFGA